MNPSILQETSAVHDASKDDRTWANIRLVVFLSLLAVFAAIIFGVYRLSGFPGLGLRYLFATLLLFGLAFWIGATYVKFVYRLPSLRLALEYLGAVWFGLSYPHLVVSEGKKQIREDEVNLLEWIGGPGYVSVQPGNVVVCERPNGQPRVYGAGRYFLRPFEKIKEIISLKEQSGVVESVSATTKDGILIQVSEIRYRYRLLVNPESKGRFARSLSNPYPFDKEAALSSVYNRNIMQDGAPASWDRGISLAINGVISDYIELHTVDDLTAPDLNGLDPRGEICQQLSSGPVRDRLQERGADLIWFDIGHFEIQDPQVEAQRKQAWQARWSGSAELVRSMGEAERVRNEEIGRAEAQAEMLRSILHAFEDIHAEGDSQQNIRNLILLRTAQIIEAMKEQVHLIEKKPERH
jgi:regulator of protease activity HflC (stomatin/prohibitin superfamily)